MRPDELSSVDSREAEIDREVEGLVQEKAKATDAGQRISDAIYYLIQERASLLRGPRRRRAT